MLTAEKIVQMHTDFRYTYVYCFGQRIQIDDGKPVNCTNDVFRIERTKSITINGLRVPLERKEISSTMKLSSAVNTMVNSHLFPELRRQAPKGNSLENLIQEKEKLLDGMTTGTMLELHWGLSTTTVLVSASALLCALYLCYRISKMQKIRERKMVLPDGL